MHAALVSGAYVPFHRKWLQAVQVGRDRGCLGQGGCLLVLDNPAPCAGSIKGLQCPALLLPLPRSRASCAFSIQLRYPSPRRSAPTGQPAGG